MNIKALKKTLFASLCVSGICVVTPAYAYWGDFFVPKYSTDEYAVYVYNIANTHAHLFGSDGYYCRIQSLDSKQKSVGGRWVRQDNNIHITYHTPKRQFFGLWNYWDGYPEFSIDVKMLADAHGFDGQPFLLGIGGDTPNSLAVFDPSIHSLNQPIPQGTKYVFVGEPTKGTEGYLLTAFSLENFDKIKAHNKDSKHYLSLASTPNTFSDDEIAKHPKTFQVYDETLFIDETPATGFISDDTNTDVIMISNVLDECQGGNPLRSLTDFYQEVSETPKQKAIIPFLVPNSHTLVYQGEIDDGSWLKKQQ